MMRRLLHPLLVIAAFVSAAIAWPRLPQRVPVHWNVAGEVDRYGSRFEGAFLMPLMMVFIWALLRVLPKIDPRRTNYAKMEGTYEVVVTGTLLLLLAIHAALLGTALGYPVPIDTIVPLAVGTLFITLGNVMPRARPNWWFGVRTPWTMSNDKVWMRTHRIAGYAMVVAGLAMIATIFVPPRLKLLVIGAVILSALFPLAYSYYAWRQETTSR